MKKLEKIIDMVVEAYDEYIDLEDINLESAINKYITDKIDGTTTNYKEIESDELDEIEKNKEEAKNRVWNKVKYFVTKFTEFKAELDREIQKEIQKEIKK